MFSFFSSLKELCFYVALGTDTLVSCILWRMFFTISSMYASFSYLVPLPSHLNPSSLSLLREIHEITHMNKCGSSLKQGQLTSGYTTEENGSPSPRNWDCLQSRMRRWRIQSWAGGQTCWVSMIAMAMRYIGESHHSISCPPGLIIFPPLVHDGLLFLVGEGGSERTWWCLNAPHGYSYSGV